MKPECLNNHRGFTLIELVFTLVVAGILIMLAVPQFKEALSNNNRNSKVNTLISALNLTRSEAVSRGMDVIMCRSSDSASCNTAVSSEGVWENGWIIYADLNGNGNWMRSPEQSL